MHISFLNLKTQVATTADMTIAMGPVGPELWDRVPPKNAAKNPTAMAPYRPTKAPNPDATPKARATGRPTTVEVKPPKTSPFWFFRSKFTKFTSVRIPWQDDSLPPDASLEV